MVPLLDNGISNLGSAIRSFYPIFFNSTSMAKLGNDHAMLVVFSHRAWDPCPAHAEEAQLYHVGVSPSLFEFWASKEASNHEKNQPGEANIKRKKPAIFGQQIKLRNMEASYISNKKHRSQWSQIAQQMDWQADVNEAFCFWFIACDGLYWLHLRALALALVNLLSNEVWNPNVWRARFLSSDTGWFQACPQSVNWDDFSHKDSERLLSTEGFTKVCLMNLQNTILAILRARPQALWCEI